MERTRGGAERGDRGNPSGGWFGDGAHASGAERGDAEHRGDVREELDPKRRFQPRGPSL
jgi:hypothetical protein